MGGGAQRRGQAQVTDAAGGGRCGRALLARRDGRGGRRPEPRGRGGRRGCRRASNRAGRVPLGAARPPGTASV